MNHTVTRDDRALARRIAAERKVARRTIRALRAAGYTLGVHNGEELVLHHAADERKILAEMFTVDEEHLIAYGPDGKRAGSVFFVYGNAGYEVINDYSLSLDAVMEPVLDYASELQD